MEKYSKEIEEAMLLFYKTLNEKEKRHYASLEARKLGHGGMEYISNLLDISPRTLNRGSKEYSSGSLLKGRIRKEGGGRKKKEHQDEQLTAKINNVVNNHLGGCPQTGNKWTYLSPTEIQKILLSEGCSISTAVLRRCLQTLGLGKRSFYKYLTYKNVQYRDEQFQKIEAYKNYYLSRGYPVWSIDTKKKEQLGRFYRKGNILAATNIACLDHDFASYGSGKIVPYGIYDVGLNQGAIYIGQSADTAQFAVHCLFQYWNQYGQHQYDPNMPILLLADSGGANGARVKLFKQEIQQWADECNLKIRVAHYPPYCSKYNPIEHRFFPAISNAWKGVILDSVNKAIQMIQIRCTIANEKLKVFVHKVDEVFEKGVKVMDNFLEDYCNIIFEKYLGKWNYRFFPNS